MAIVITLDSELEQLLQEKAAQHGQDINAMASELLARVLAWEEQDFAEAVQGIQQGLNDFNAGQFRSFQDFSEEQQRKYHLP